MQGTHGSEKNGPGAADDAGNRRGKPRARKAPKRITPSYLNNVALWYLGRYAGTAMSLRRVLMRRVTRSCRHHGTDSGPTVGEASTWVEDLIQRFVRSGLLDDARFAEGRARSLFDRGLSPRRIRGKLMEKGVSAAEIDAALEKLHEVSTDPERSAAYTYARRRRIGPFGPAEGREERREKDLGRLARAGFSWDIARTILDADEPDDLICPEAA